MTLKVKQRRLAKPLAAFGFSIGQPTSEKHSFTFVRQSYTDELFESIIVTAGGKRAEAVDASVGVSVTSAVMYKLLGEVRLLFEVSEEKDEGVTVIENEHKAREWEKELVRIAPPLAREWAKAKGASLLAATANARNAVKKYLDILKPISDLSELEERLRRGGNSKIVAEADRRYSGEEKEEEVARLAILMFSEEVDGKSFLEHKFSEIPLMQRVKILADRLLLAGKSTMNGDHLAV